MSQGALLLTRPLHCSQTALSTATLPRFLRSNVLSSASASDQAALAAKSISFFSSTYFLWTVHRRLPMDSIDLWFTPRRRWMVAWGTLFSFSMSRVACVRNDAAPAPRASTKSGWRCWGLMYTWQVLQLHRFRGFSPPWRLERVPFPYRGQTLPWTKVHPPEASRMSVRDLFHICGLASSRTLKATSRNAGYRELASMP